MQLNWDTIRGNWNQLQGQAKQQWGELTDDDLMKVRGNRDELVGVIQERYGLTQEAAQRQVDEWASQHQDIPRA